MAAVLTPSRHAGTSRRATFERRVREHPGWPRLLVEGDSWFCFPSKNMIDVLAEDRGYNALFLQENGDTVANMVRRREYAPFLRQPRRHPWRAFLFSGGGNDFLGDPLPGLILKKRGSEAPGRLVDRERLGAEIARIESLYAGLIRDCHGLAPGVPVIAHGYDYAIPRRRGVSLFWVNVAGPWLHPVLVGKGITNPSEQRAVVRMLIDAFNEMLGRLDREFANFHYIDFRGTVRDDEWNDELHPKRPAFRRLADKLDAFLRGLP